MGLFDNLTPRQRDVYKFIREKIRGRGYGPTVREIATRFDINSPNGVVCHLKALVKKGFITREPNMARAIRLAAEPIEERGLPLNGTIAAGVLHEAIEQNERVDFQEMLTPSTKNRIADGDYVVVQKQRTARKGQIVVALTEEGEATLKRWFPEKNRIRLEPSNSSMKPIYVKNARVLGVIVGVVRKVG